MDSFEFIALRPCFQVAAVLHAKSAATLAQAYA